MARHRPPRRRARRRAARSRGFGRKILAATLTPRAEVGGVTADSHRPDPAATVRAAAAEPPVTEQERPRAAWASAALAALSIFFMLANSASDRPARPSCRGDVPEST